MLFRFKLVVVLLAVMICTPELFSQRNNDLIRITRDGRMVWRESGEEAFFWGVNYTTPFAHAYRQIARLGEDREKVIDADTYHFARLGLNAYRIHVWDCEISDSVGNLLQNDHLRLLDYLIHKLQQRGIYVFLTPIAYWGNGYPEPNEKTPGFSGKYNKGNVYIIPEAIEAQERYLKQFVNHVNPYTGKAYKNDPMIIGFEICNEPGHSRAAETTAFVKRMIRAVKSTGCTKPVFYNVTQSINLLEDFIRGGTDGVTFQWYPAGLVAGKEIKGNYLPHVDNYYMPFRDEKYFRSQVRLVYEFDAADVGRSYLYPPMALSFKEAGMQWVTMFSYDPLVMAPANTEYQTHFLNLACAPQKAIGFMIAGELFRNQQFKRDRENEKAPFEMDGVTISYTEDLAVLAAKQLFYHTNNTSITPPDKSTLTKIAGYGSSPVVSYNGCGAWFLDKIEDGIWRLEVMPDAIWVRDPFSRATPRIENVVIKWNNNEMKIDLPDLGRDFSIKGINEGNSVLAITTDGAFQVLPGTYILSAGQIPKDIIGAGIGVIGMNEFHAPPEKNRDLYFLHDAPSQVSEGQPAEVNVTVVTPGEPFKQLTLLPSVFGLRGRGSFRPVQIPMEKINSHRYRAFIPDTLVRPGILNYTILAESASGKITVWPGKVDGPPSGWDYYNPDSYSVRLIPAGGEVLLFSAESAGQINSFTGRPGLRSNILLSGVPGKTTQQFTLATGSGTQTRSGTTGVIYAMQNYIGDAIRGISAHTDRYSQISVNGRASGPPVKINVVLIDRNGNAFSTEALLTDEQESRKINLNDLKKSQMLLLPRPYPGFLPLWYQGKGSSFSLADVERLQLIVPAEGNEGLEGFELRSITLE
ncbi:MAG: cellulase family glycosylhydrolase [Bacteroidales bacterium]|nr:cellulase family glycosylhydrolase [Bacteroidales bacterium]